MKKKQAKKRRGAHPPLQTTLQTREVDHVDEDGAPQLTDRAVEEAREWVEFTKL